MIDSTTETIDNHLHGFPALDYPRHPAYQSSNMSARNRLKALKEYWPDYWGGMYQYKENKKRLIKNTFAYRHHQAPDALERLENQGILVHQVDPSYISALKEKLNKAIGYDMDTKEITNAEIRRYFHFQDEDPEIEAIQLELLKRYDILELARYYTRAKEVGCAGWKLRLQAHAAGFKTNLFDDIDYPTPVTNYLHVDSSYPRSMLKMVLYLGTVDSQNGPFCYVPGSQRLKEPVWRVIARRVNHKNRMQRWDPDSRQKFMQLPKCFRHKAEFGNDVIAESDLHKLLLSHEKQITSDQGNFILFDNSGMHRGGLIKSGKRICLQWTINVIR